jgi:hypothetical protein
MKYNTLLFFLLFSVNSLFAQPLLPNETIVEVSGIILSRNDQNRMQYIPFATVFVKNTNRGTYANFEGMFTMVVKKGESLSFSAVGFSEFILKIPADYEGLYYSAIIELQPKDLDMAEVVIFPWPDRDNFRAEFLAMNPTEAMQMETVARNNLNRRKMLEIGTEMGMDARENAMYYLQKQASSYSYMGQGQPMPILNPLAWSQFFRQWSNKKKKKDDD